MGDISSPTVQKDLGDPNQANVPRLLGNIQNPMEVTRESLSILNLEHEDPCGMTKKKWAEPNQWSYDSHAITLLVHSAGGSALSAPKSTAPVHLACEEEAHENSRGSGVKRGREQSGPQVVCPLSEAKMELNCPKFLKRFFKLICSSWVLQAV